MSFSRTPQAADQVCSLIADGYTLRQIAQKIDCGLGTISQWAAEDAKFAELYARAKMARLEAMADELVDISDEGVNDWYDRELDSGGVVQAPDHEHIARSKLRVDTRKWLLSKLVPKQYGDKLAVEHSGEIGLAERLVAARTRALSPPTIEHEALPAPENETEPE